jgi:voltage-gated potassium channel Kch
LRADGVPVLCGDASYRVVLAAARLERARILIVALPDFGAARVVVLNARQARSDIDIVVRARDPRSAALLRQAGARAAVEPELEGGLEMLRHALSSIELGAEERERIMTRARTGSDLEVAVAAIAVAPVAAPLTVPAAPGERVIADKVNHAEERGDQTGDGSADAPAPLDGTAGMETPPQSLARHN